MANSNELLEYRGFLNWATKNRRNLLISTAAVIGGVATGFGIYYYGKNIFSMQNAIAVKEDDDVDDDRVQVHFETVQRISDTTTLPSVLPHLKTRLLELINLNELTEALVFKPGQEALSTSGKSQIWRELKILSFTRTFCAIWSLSLVDLFVRVQLNILGRRLYFDMAREASNLTPEDEKKQLTSYSQRIFLAFSDYLPEKGLEGLIADCRLAAEAVVSKMHLGSHQTLIHIKEAFKSIIALMDQRHFEPVRYVLPFDNELPEDLISPSSVADSMGSNDSSTSPSSQDDEMLDSLLTETRDILYSREFRSVFRKSISETLEGAMIELERVYDPSKGTSLAKLLPLIAQVGNTLLDQPPNNPVVQRLSELEEMKAFCALVYSDSIGC